MKRRHLAMLATAVTLAFSVTTVAAAGALAPSVPATHAAKAAPTIQKSHQASQALAKEAALAERERAMAVGALIVAEEARAGAALGAHEAVQTSMFGCIRDAESGDNYSLTSGAYGILISTWDAYSAIWSPWGSFAVPGDAPDWVQDLVAYKLYLIGGGYGGWHDRCTEG
jgi:hypothetical protein